MLKPFSHYQQFDAMDCGPTCLRMIARHYGRSYSLQNLREHSFITREGVSMLGISDAAEGIGFRTQGVRISFEQVVNEVPFPCILHWSQNHFVVLYGIKKKRKKFLDKNTDTKYTFLISDPAKGKYPIDEEGFRKCWISTKNDGKEVGAALLLSPTPEFYEKIDDKEQQTRNHTKDFTSLGFFYIEGFKTANF